MTQLFKRYGIPLLILFFSLPASAKGTKQMRVIIRESRVDCPGQPEGCLQLRYHNKDSWRTLESGIKGFRHVPGYRYTLLVNRSYRTGSQPSDSDFVYTLKKIAGRKWIASKKQEAGDHKIAWNYIARYQWKLLQVNGQSQPDSKAYIVFDTLNKKISGFGGCNSFSGGYTAAGDSIGFTGVMSTLMACVDNNGTRYEAAFLQLLRKNGFRFDIADQVLNFYDGNKLVLMFGRSELIKNREIPSSSSGIKGRVLWLEGNHMPAIGRRSGITRPVERELLVYKAIPVQKAKASDQPGFYDSVEGAPVASVRSDKEGNYSVILPPGRYSIFIKENGKLWAPMQDGEGILQPVLVSPDSFSSYDLSINYMATY